MDWSLNPLFGSYTLVGLVTLGLIAFLFLVRESGRVTRWQRAILWTFRLLIFLVVLVVLLKPGITFTRQSTPRGTIAVMLDASASMVLPSGDEKLSRWDSERAIWEAIYDARDAFGKDATLAPFIYDSTLKQLGSIDGKAVNANVSLPDQAEGFSTDVGGTLNQLLSVPFEAPLSAVIWMGDGAQTQVPAGGDAQQVARRLAQMDVPMYVVGIGPRSDSDNAQDLAVKDVPEQLDTFIKNATNVRGLVHCRGVANRELTIKLLMIQKGKPPKEVAVDRIRPNKSEQTLSFRLPLVAPGEAGAYEYLVRAEPVAGEAIELNNESTVYLNVRGGGAQILYLEGELRAERTFLQRAIAESPDIQLSMRDIGKPPVEKWPIDLSQQMSDSVYDCIVLGDVDFRAIEAVGANTIAEQVRKGAGLVTLGGYHAYGAGGWDQSALRDILPVSMVGQKRQELNKPKELANQTIGTIQVVPVGANEILQIDAPEKNEATWRSLKPLLGASKWEGLKRTPGTQLLAQTPQKQPLIVSGIADKGRVVSIAFDSSYLWWRQGKSAEHKAFWRKILYWCMRRETVEEGMQLSMPKRRLFLKESSEVVLQWSGGSDLVTMPQNISMHLWKLGDGSATPDQDLGDSRLVRRDEKSMRLPFPGSKEGGRYEWRANVMSSKGKMLEAKLPFVIIDQSLETIQGLPDWQLMNQMAKLNASAGGVLVAPEQTDEIVQQILDRRKQSTQTAIENRKLGDGLLDTWTAFLLFAMLFLGQWGLRKRWSLP